MSIATLWARIAGRITAGTEAMARFMTPALPWLYLALRRALVPTLTWLVVAAMFFVVPQSREVLHGLGEPMLGSLRDFRTADPGAVNVLGLFSYVATAVLMSLALWYAARLLCTVEREMAAPNILELEGNKDDLRRAIVWYPRGLGVSALAAAVGALVYASYTPQLPATTALLWSVLCVAGPLLLVSAELMRRSSRGGGRRPWLYAIGALATAASAVVLWREHAKPAMWMWSVGSSLLPAALLYFLVRRRTAWARTGRSEFRHASATVDFGAVLLTIVVLAAMSLGVLLLLALAWPVVMRAYGSAAAVLLFLGAAALMLSAAHLVVRRIASQVPGLTASALAVVIALVLVFGDEDLGHEALEARPLAVLNAAPQPVVGAEAAAPAAAAPRVVYVNAYGGGLRAAVFTAQVLARADDATCGEFGDRVAAFSGVSGGSVGIGTYLLARQELKARGGWGDCKDRPATETPGTPLSDIVTGALVQDHLSPVIGRMLAVDAPHFWPAPVRGQALLDSWNDALVQSLADHFKDRKEQPDALRKAESFAGMALPLGLLTGGFANPPQVYFNTTDTDSGHITWFSNAGHAGTYPNRDEPVAMSVGQAVLHSARFPVVTPAGGQVLPWNPREARLVDGGYTDNSGTTRLFEVMTGASPPHTPGEQVRLVNIDGNPSDESPCSRAAGHPPILTGVQALLQARSAHALRAVERFEQSIRDKGILVRLDLEEAFAEPGAALATICRKVARSEQAPLGWYMSYGAATTVATSAGLGVTRMCEALGLNCRLSTAAAVAQK